MTVPSEVTETSYALAGTSLGPFNTAWSYEDADDVLVFIDVGEAGPQLQTINVDYTLAAVGDPTTGGGNVTLLAAALDGQPSWAANSAITLKRQTSEDQPSALGEEEEFSPTLYEQALDHLDRQIEDVRQTGNRAAAFPVGEAGQTFADAIPRSNKLVGFDNEGNFDYFGFEIDGATGDIAAIIGPPGPDGPPGEQGIPGPPGAGTLGYTPLNKAGDTWTDGQLVPGFLNEFAAGFMGVPVDEEDANYVLVAADFGECIRHNNAADHTVTIPPNSGVAFPVGAVIWFRNTNAGGNQVLTRGAGVTLTIAGLATSQDVTVSPNGFGFLYQEAANTWIASGVQIA